jgi:hypothetical protein
MNLKALAIYIKYVIRPRRVIHYSMDHGEFAKHCELIGQEALAIDCNEFDHARCSNVIYRNWHHMPISIEEVAPEPLENLDDVAPLLILITDIPRDFLYFTAPNIVKNWTLAGTKIWIMDTQIDRWIAELGYKSYIVDIDATVHAVVNLNLPTKHAIVKRTY